MTSLEDARPIQPSDATSTTHLRQRRRHHTTDGISASTSDAADIAAELEHQKLTQVLEETSSRSVSKCFVLSALVVFGFVFVSSIPNILSANGGNEHTKKASGRSPAVSEGGGGAVRVASKWSSPPQNPVEPGAVNPPNTAENPARAFNRHSNLPDLDQTADLASADFEAFYRQQPLEVGGQQQAAASSMTGQKGPAPVAPLHAQLESIHPQTTTLYASSRSPSSAPIVVLASPSAIPLQQPYNTHQRAQQQQGQHHKQTTSITDSAAWHALSTMTKFSLRATLWSVHKGCQAFSYMIIRPLMAVFIPIWSLFVEKPYEIVRDIIRAFLPVYTFFSAAAVIGVCVGGILTWAGQIIIMAVGASEEEGLTVSKSLVPVHNMHHTGSFGRRTMQSTQRATVSTYSVGLEQQDLDSLAAGAGDVPELVQPPHHRGMERRRSSISILKDTIVGGAGSLLSHVAPGRGETGGRSARHASSGSAASGGPQGSVLQHTGRRSASSRRTPHVTEPVFGEDGGSTTLGTGATASGGKEHQHGYTFKDEDYDISRARYYHDDEIVEEDEDEEDDDDDDDDDDPQPDRGAPGGRWQHILR